MSILHFSTSFSVILWVKQILILHSDFEVLFDIHEKTLHIFIWNVQQQQQKYKMRWSNSWMRMRRIWWIRRVYIYEKECERLKKGVPDKRQSIEFKQPSNEDKIQFNYYNFMNLWKSMRLSTYNWEFYKFHLIRKSMAECESMAEHHWQTGQKRT